MKNFIMAVISGTLSLFLGMGIARFAFTPILPLMQSDFGFTDTISGALASANFLGYLLGALFVKKLTGGENTYAWFKLSVVSSVIFVAMMWFEIQYLWYPVRFLSGFSSAVLFVLSSEFILLYLLKENQYGTARDSITITYFFPFKTSKNHF